VFPQSAYNSPANIIAYSAAKAFLRVFTTSLRAFSLFSGPPLSKNPTVTRTHPESEYWDRKALPIEVTLLIPGFTETRAGRFLREHKSKDPVAMYENPTRVAREVKKRVEEGRVGIIMWPWEQGNILWALRGRPALSRQ